MNNIRKQLQADIANEVSAWPLPYLLILSDDEGGHSAFSQPSPDADMVVSQIEFARILLKKASQDLRNLATQPAEGE